MDKHENRMLLSDLVWNYGSFGFLVMGGFIFSFIIIRFYGVETLGVFNQVYAYYLLLSQFSVCGIHMSVVKHVSELHPEDRSRINIFYTALLATVAISMVVMVMLLVFLLICSRFGDSAVIRGMWTLIPALLFFSLNKVVLGYFNGCSLMKAYAVFQSLRNILIALSLVFLSILKIPGHMISLCFFIAELLLFIASMAYLVATRNITGTCLDFKIWMKRHLLFGMQIFPGNLILEVNSKIDIICLSLILQDNTLIGYYSFASLFSEGFYQIFVVIRRNVNPLIARYYVDGKMQTVFTGQRDKLASILRLASVPAAGLLIAVYYVMCGFIGSEYIIALLPLAIVAVSISANSRSIVLGNILSQTGFPLYESIVNVISAAINLFLNLILIYFWGLIGTAIATAFSYTIFSVLLKHYSKQNLGVNI